MAGDHRGSAADRSSLKVPDTYWGRRLFRRLLHRCPNQYVDSSDLAGRAEVAYRPWEATQRETEAPR